MPLLRFDLIEGRSAGELKMLLDATHAVLIAAFGVPARDRYQVVHEHKPSRMIVEDTGLGLDRTDKVVLLQISSRPRTREQKQEFYRLLVDKLERTCGIPASDVIVTFVINQDEDWSFGMGRAQFLLGEL